MATDPVTTTTGQLEDDIRPRHVILPPQTHADARVELAGILANLREYTAFYQIGSMHGQVALDKPLKPDHLDEEAIEEVRQRSKALYGRPIQETSPLDDTPHPSSSGQPSQPSPHSSGPRIGRRPPRPTT